MLSALALACATLSSSATAGAAAPHVASLPFCQRVVVSPAFTTDGTAFCGTVVFEKTASFRLYVTDNRGQTWHTVNPAGVNASSGELQDLQISPDFPTDHMIVAEIAGGNVYYSLDAGQTFRLAPSLLGGGRITLVPATLPVVPANPRQAVAHGQILGAVPSGTRGRSYSYLYDPVLSTLRPVAGTPTLDEGFFPSPHYATDRIAFAAGSNPTGADPSDETVTLYACDTSFTCRTKVHTFAAPNFWLDQMVFAPDYSRHRTLLVTIADLAGHNHYRVYASFDGGTHFNPVRPLQAAIARLTRAGGLTTIAISQGPAGSHALFAYLVGGNAQTNRPPTDELYRSQDDGHTWQAIAHNRCMCPATAPGTLSYGAMYQSRPWAVTPALVTPAGRRMLMTTRWWPRNAPSKFTVLCSDDLGRTWSRPCD